MESSTAAIADAGLSPRDIDGIATMGETPVADASVAPRYRTLLDRLTVGRWGLLSPVVNAFHAVATGRARHVLVYRTVNMMGGSVLPPPRHAGDGRAVAERVRSAPVEERGA